MNAIASFGAIWIGLALVFSFDFDLILGFA
jgi:hypothetical protein